MKVLEPDFDGVEILREQVSEAFATRHWIEGLPSIDIMVGETIPAAPGTVASINRTLVINEAGTTVGFLLLWIEAGRLSGLEYAWVTEEPPTDLPPDEWIINQG
jgi:hypothetical protein